MSKTHSSPTKEIVFAVVMFSTALILCTVNILVLYPGMRDVFVVEDSAQNIEPIDVQSVNEAMRILQ